jgi:hypothetical protein
MVRDARLGHYLGAMGQLQRSGLLGRTLFAAVLAIAPASAPAEPASAPGDRRGVLP